MEAAGKLLLAGKLCLVTGATSGIGRATVKVFLNHGAKVFATGRNKQALEQLRDEVFSSPQKHWLGIKTGDLTEKGIPQDIVKAAFEELEGLTTVVNCAGVVKPAAFGTEQCNLENYFHNFQGNTQSVFEMMVASIPYLKNQAQKNPSIINVSSINGQVSFAGVPSYCASKAAVDMFTKCAAVDLAQFGIRVNAVNPGVVTTELQKRGGLSDEAYATFLKRSIEVTHPLGQILGRVATPEEVGELIAYLASDNAAFITGDCIRIDGGRGCLGAR